MSFFNRFGFKAGDSRRKAAHAKELSGELASAVELYLEADLPNEAARVLLLRADAESRADRRIAFCAIAAQTAQDESLRRAALRRKALLSLDLVRAQGASAAKTELLRVAHELEEATEFEQAADAYALAGDEDNEIRMLTAAGAIDRLEERLGHSMRQARHQRERDALLRKLTDLDRTAERRLALNLAQQHVAHASDERIADITRSIRARLLSSPILALESDATITRYALGDVVTFGRGDVTIPVASRAVSRIHARLQRRGSEAFIEDLGTRNGTTLAGARLAGPVPIGTGIHVMLGGQVPCAVSPHLVSTPKQRTLYDIDLAGERYMAPLGDLEVGPWLIRYERTQNEGYVTLVTPPCAPHPYLGEYELRGSVELCIGDAIMLSRSGPVVFRVVATSHTSALDEDIRTEVR